MLADEMLLLESGRVLQAGPVEAMFLRPASETAARLLGAETAAYGQVVAPDRIDVGDGGQLAAAGPPLAVGTRVGWSVRPEQVRLTGMGGHPATVQQRDPVREGWQRITLRLGDAMLPALFDPGCMVADACRVCIDPQAVQVWPAG